VVEDRQRSESKRRLTVDFSAWFDQDRISAKRYYREGLVVLDANVLLDLYRMTPEARAQVLGAFRSVVDRLWVPHQAALEFSRNRKRAVEDRMSSFRQTKQALKAASVNASSVIEKSINQLQHLRERAGTSREWGVGDNFFDQESLKIALEKVMGPALTEIATLEAEHDLFPKDMQTVDPLLEEIDNLLEGRIGISYPSEKLRLLVEEACAFRFPNMIPPGYLDLDKDTDLRSAGDYLVWRQTLDKATRIKGQERLVLMITSDLKADWWELERSGRPLGPRQELVQEMRDVAQADLMLASLKDFIVGAQDHLISGISRQTLEELEVLEESDISTSSEESMSSDILPFATPINFANSGRRDFESLIRHLLVRMGYKIKALESREHRGFDFIVTRPETPDEPIIVEAKYYKGPIILAQVLQTIGALHDGAYKSAIFITTSFFSRQARDQSQGYPIELIDGNALMHLLRIHDIEASL
jgi:hypothetical protein